MNNDISIILSGYSGEGIQHMGYHLSYIIYKNNYYIKTFSDIPSEIFSPTQKITDISEFIIKFSRKKIISYFKTKYCILLSTNYLSLKKNIDKIKNKGVIIIDFDKKNYNFLKNDKILLKRIKKKRYIKLNSVNYINFSLLIKYKIKKLSNINLLKNSLFIGFLVFYFNLSKKYSIYFLKKKFKNKNIFFLNYYLFKIGIKIGEKKKLFYKNNTKIAKKEIAKNYKIINGNLGIVLGIISSSIKYKIGIFYSSYPITPSITITKYLIKNKNYIDLKIFNAEDEISAICTSIGASINIKKLLGIIATSGPGMSLIQESLGFAVVLEIPLLIINVQRVGPSTGFPTKLEQSDLMQSIYGRHGEAPIPVFSINKINNTIHIIYNIIKISLELKTPIIVLSDIYIANNLSLWNKIKYKNLKYKKIKIKSVINKKKFKCLGGLVKNIDKHHEVIKKRQNKINLIIKNYINITYILKGNKNGNILVISWGSTYEIIKESIYFLIKKKYKIGYLHLICLYPLPSNLIEKISKKYNKIIIFELNNKQLFYIIKSYCKINIKLYNVNKMTGYPFTKLEIIKNIKKIL
ncbi:MAG: 2-oxoacid:acceptor oxidoreductase family protein [Candidatus Shikimatogenerans bostrichidophilus]|nr:MAG: 2-oxoacid:acceptor oxidoreductase family protein [Candidatus Shikimatogenerans bostrichidophilus]